MINGHKVLIFYLKENFIIYFLFNFFFLTQGKKRSKKSQPDSEDSNPKWNMVYVVNYVTYLCVGWVAISGVPLLCHSVGLVL